MKSNRLLPHVKDRCYVEHQCHILCTGRHCSQCVKLTYNWQCVVQQTIELEIRALSFAEENYCAACNTKIYIHVNSPRRARLLYKPDGLSLQWWRHCEPLMGAKHQMRLSCAIEYHHMPNKQKLNSEWSTNMCTAHSTHKHICNSWVSTWLP